MYRYRRYSCVVVYAWLLVDSSFHIPISMNIATNMIIFPESEDTIL